LDGLRLIEAGWQFQSITDQETGSEQESGLETGDSPKNSLQQDVQLLWCRSWAEEREYGPIWRRLQPMLQPRPGPSREKRQPPPPPLPPPLKESEPPLPPATYQPPPPQATEEDKSAVSALPVKTPPAAPPRPALAELTAYWPIHRRAIGYGWQALRRTRSNGDQTVLDLAATVEQVARQGYLTTPVYCPEERAHTHLALFIDCEGSMMPFHPLARDFVAAAERAALEGLLGRLDVFYFHNVIGDDLYLDSRLSKLVRTVDRQTRAERPAKLEESIAHFRRETNIVIFSDAGAARGHRSLNRITMTEEMLSALSQKSTLMVWLNPMPQRRWQKTSAKIIASLAPMFEVDKLGFNDAIKTLRGKSKRIA
jgi:uncharacterized protein